MPEGQTAAQAEAENVREMSQEERQKMRDADFAGKPGAVPQVDQSQFDRTTQEPRPAERGKWQTADEIEEQNRRIMQNTRGISGTIDGVGGRAPSQPHETVPGTQTTGNRQVFESPDSNAQRVIDPDPAMQVTGQPLRTPDIESGQTADKDGQRGQALGTATAGGEGQTQSEGEQGEDADPKYDEMTVEDLREHARQNEISLHGASTKADIIKEIKKADRAKAREAAKG